MESDNILNQLNSLFIFILSGIIIGIFFDIFRVLRKTFKTPDFITYIEDALFWILTGFFLLVIIFVFQDGQIRNYTILGLIIGIIIYVLTISKYFIKINVFVVNLCKNIINKILKVLLYPLKIIFKPIYFLVINIRNNVFLKNKIQKNTKKYKK